MEECGDAGLRVGWKAAKERQRLESGQDCPGHPRVSSAGRLLLCLSIAFMLLARGGAARADPAVASEQHTWRVVLIRSWDSQYPINILREKALREALLKNAPRVVDIYAEEIDPLRFYAPDIEQEFLVLLEKKYRERKIDLVIATGKEPLEFATRYRDRIWPGAAIVFNGVVDGTLDRSALGPRTTGVTMVWDVQGTLALGLAVVPSAREVYFVAGDGPFERFYLSYALEELARFEQPLKPRLLVGLSRAALLDRVANLDSRALVFYVSMLRDSSGQTYPPGSDTLAQIAQRSPAPVIAAVSTQFLRGPLGGSSAPIDAHGRAAGLLARQVLEGADPDRLPVRADPAPECQVDWQAMNRWNISEHDIPPDCRIVNRPPSVWQAYFWPLLGLISIIVLQAALIWALVLQRRRTRHAEAQARARGAEMAQVARLSMMGALTASIAHEINQPMGAILSNTDAAEMMLDQGTLDTPKLREILADIRSEDLRASEVIRGLRKMLARRESNATAIELNAEVAEALRHLAFDAARRGVRLVPEFDGTVPPILGDSVQLQQVLINLVVNAMDAVAAEPEQEREVRIETHARAGGAEVVVADRGPGIPPGQLGKVFDSMFTTKKEGMGLGLSIVRTIVEMHGGRVSHVPNVPHGAVFRVWLPAIGT
jgi:signal transduction histidine kinase